MKVSINRKKVIARVGRPNGRNPINLRRRVLKCLELRAQGFSHLQIGKYLGISQKTLSRYFYNNKYKKYRENPKDRVVNTHNRPR